MARLYPQFIECDTDVIAVGPDSPERFRRFFTAARIPFPGIPDPECAILETYAQAVVWWRFGRMPAQFLIARPRGVVRFAEYAPGQRAFTPAQQMLAYARRLG